jgi:FKBP-type peptidyl-prolyl cis-trans isomerase FklB
VKGGQYVLLHSVMSHKDSVLSDTRLGPGRPTVVKVEANEADRLGGSGPIQDLLEQMSVGDSARFFYPIDSFPTKPPRLKDFDEVTYDLVILDIFETEEELQVYMDAEREKINAPLREAQEREKGVSELMNTFYESYKRGEKDKLWQTTESGLKYIILEKGPSGLKAKPGEIVRAHTHGVFVENGKPFYSSFTQGQTNDFSLGNREVIPAWDEAFALLAKGDKAVLLVPANLAYGEQGHPGGIPPNAELFFYVEFVGIGDLD